MSPRSEQLVNLVGRVCLSLIFLMSAFGKLTNWNGTAGYMASKNLPAIPVLLILAVLFELVGGLSVLTGYKARWGASLLVVFLLIVTPIFHNFWAVSGADQQNQMIHFLKNVAILGGLLQIVARGAGPASLEREPVTLA
jgi:putative oxidoreductase